MKIVIPDSLNLPERHIKELKEFGDVVIYHDTPRSESEICQRISDAEIIIPNWIKITTHIIRNARSLKFIIIPAVGYENIDMKAASRAGIIVSNCPTHNTRAVAEHTIGLVFSVTRRIIEANADLKNGEWHPNNYTGIELKDKRLGLIGYGNIGKTVAEIARNIGMVISYTNSKTPVNELDQLISDSDIISLHLPITDKTRHLIDERRLRIMKKEAYLINTSRGAIIDQNALIKVLESGHLRGIALDVFEDEPYTGKPSEGLLELVKYRNVIATPHIAFNTQEAACRLGDELMANIRAVINGKPLHVVS